MEDFVSIDSIASGHVYAFKAPIDADYYYHLYPEIPDERISNSSKANTGNRIEFNDEFMIVQVERYKNGEDVYIQVSVLEKEMIGWFCIRHHNIESSLLGFWQRLA